MSPGEHTKKVLVQHDLKRTKDCERKSSTPFKKRPSFKSKKRSALECNEMREGTTYASGINVKDSSTADDIHEIPPPSSSPTISTLADGNYTFICFDLETTGFGMCFHKWRQIQGHTIFILQYVINFVHIISINFNSVILEFSFI